MANSTAAFILGCLMFLALIAIVIFGATAIDDSIVMIITFIAAGCLTIIFIFVCIVGIVKLCRMLIAGDDKNEETV